jgi:alkylation response protein AidB-like acyl-CoA dehydrogenase
VVAIEIISRADAALMNVFGLQEISETIYRFGTDDQKERYLPRFCRGEVLGSMALTEPDAGSDLQAVALAATQKEDGKWYLNGVKRFITNGNAQISLVMARSEKDVSGGRGLSLFIYERDHNMRIRRIEEKYGIHGSPTCELQFNDAPAELLGKRKFGLIKYTISLMNGARLAVAAQALGIAEAAYREADAYATSRVQFGKPIRELTQVREMLLDMRVAIEAGRSLLYETARIVDLKENMEEAIEHHPELQPGLQEELKRYTKYAALFTPALKAYTTEMGNKVCYDALQVHGGSGYTKDYSIERMVRDVRVTNIYEGTTQMQVLAAVGGIISGVIFERLNDYESAHDFSAIPDIIKNAMLLRGYLEASITHIKEKGNKPYQEYHERRLVDMANDTIMGYLLCIDALRLEYKQKIAKLFLAKALPRNKAIMEYILSDDTLLLDFTEFEAAY